MEQTIAGNEKETPGTLQIITESAEYLRNVVLKNDIFEGIYSKCMNKHRLCSFWASMDMCTKNPDYMVRDEFCILACQQCAKKISDQKTGRSALPMEQTIARNEMETSGDNGKCRVGKCGVGK